MTEEFRDILGYEGIYLVSNKGNVWTNYRKNGVERILKPIKNKGGYLIVNLYKYGKKKQFLIHRLVAQAFIVNHQNKPFVNHIDGNRQNNLLSNIEWCTQKENVTHAIHVLHKWSQSEKQSEAARATGIKNRKLNFETAELIRSEYKAGGTSSIKLSKKYKISKPCILRIINNKSYITKELV